jgi:hypothetical protein
MTMYMDARVMVALEPYGFKDGKYGTVPYHLLYHALSIEQTDYTTAYYIMADGRSMGEVWVEVDGTIDVRLRIANWINPKPLPFFTSTKPVFMGQIPIRTDVRVPMNTLVVQRYQVLERPIEHIEIKMTIEIE